MDPPNGFVVVWTPIRSALKLGSDTRAFSWRAIGAKEKCQDKRFSMANVAKLRPDFPDHLSL
jgi:hypothetical protein